MCFNAWLLGGKIHRKLLTSSDKYQLQEGNVLFSPPMPFSTHVVIFVGKVASWKQFFSFTTHPPKPTSPLGGKKKFNISNTTSHAFPKSSKTSHSYCSAIVRYHTTGFRVKPGCNYKCGEGQSTPFAKPRFCPCEEEKSATIIRQKQVPAGVEEF